MKFVVEMASAETKFHEVQYRCSKSCYDGYRHKQTQSHTEIAWRTDTPTFAFFKITAVG
jgi:hypothetical protein